MWSNGSYAVCDRVSSGEWMEESGDGVVLMVLSSRPSTW